MRGARVSFSIMRRRGSVHGPVLTTSPIDSTYFYPLVLRIWLATRDGEASMDVMPQLQHHVGNGPTGHVTLCNGQPSSTSVCPGKPPRDSHEHFFEGGYANGKRILVLQHVGTMMDLAASYM